MKKSTLALSLGLALLASASLVACGDSEESGSSTTAAAGAELTVTDVWARKVLQQGAVYMDITGGAEDDALTGASVPADVAGEAQIHETTMAATTTTAAGDASSSTTAAGGMSGEMSGEMSGGMAGGMSGDEMSGGMSMKEVDKVDVPAGEKVQLKPGGFHVMLLEVKKDLKAGDTFEVTLTFEKAGTKKVTAEVRAL